MPIENVSDTALWVAYYRAMETDRPDAIFRDPFARRLAGARGEEIVNTMKRGRSMAWAMIVRTAVYDEIIMSVIANKHVDTVLNIAAGLDARPWRLALPPDLRWVDVDLPDILKYKTETLKDEKPRCRYEAVAADMTDAEARRSLFSRIGAESRHTLIVTEGLLIYLTPEQVASLARDLAQPAAFRWWLIDLASPRLLKLMLRTWGTDLEKGNAPFKFAPAEGTDFFPKCGWHEAEYRSAMEEARRLNREMAMMPFWRFLMNFYPAKTRKEFGRMSAYVLLDR